jgi:hypothetical protein
MRAFLKVSNRCFLMRRRLTPAGRGRGRASPRLEPRVQLYTFTRLRRYATKRLQEKMLERLSLVSGNHTKSYKKLTHPGAEAFIVAIYGRWIWLGWET